jgi:hypothetical protein
MKIRIPPVNESPDDTDVHFLDDRINQYNFETTGITDGRLISFFVRDERARDIPIGGRSPLFVSILSVSTFGAGLWTGIRG